MTRPACTALISAFTFALLPGVPAHAAESATPHLDTVEGVLREVSPGLEGDIWERTSGNRLDPASWLLQTPGCWEDAGCKDRSGTKRLLAKMTGDISRATRTIDISSLAPFPDGGFQDAIVAGLEAAVASGHRLKVRILVGAAPVYHMNVLPLRYRDDLRRKLGPAAEDITLNVASMTTSKTSFSWNHSKLLVVDGESAIAGGINDWKGDYLDTDHPVTDVDLALSGPAAGTAGRYLDRLWKWTCRNRTNIADVWYVASDGADCMAGMEQETNLRTVPATGDVPVIAVGGLGVGIEDADFASAWHPTSPNKSETRCTIGLHDHTNQDRGYDTVNPEESALRALISSATHHIEISQQDLNATCPPLPRYDERIYDALAAKLVAGVKVRIVVSDPANRGAVGSGGYSQIKSLSEISDVLRSRLTRITGDEHSATAALCSNLQLATFRSSASEKWADGHPYAQHHKLVSVDDSAFYIGSKNLYPAWLQDFGYIVESPNAAQQLDTQILSPQWAHSKETATVDYEQGHCHI
ncbi:phospholipase D-like domain-containing protein [Streptomyces sp. AK02-04a]|uniref:phospholipase D-like domain-containing protein n=1 Tax=Streptomyces sp. AK02-04a TaxID=3028649 RepID=UPI0029A6B014|nr:phospholipase D-like domain-containing protein [Streptomyces sp. AK02-04a]MDX3764028.1 phospholipase D-like domain-containing protein [Streptomyces sp. AK02-04a]